MTTMTELVTVMMFFTGVWALLFHSIVDTANGNFLQQILWKFVPLVVGVFWLVAGLDAIGLI